MAVWTAIMLVAVRFLTGPRWFALGALLAVVELSGGNISLLLAVAMVIGFRWPAAWAFVILTKVTPGIGLLWFAVRRAWRPAGDRLRRDGRRRGRLGDRHAGRLDRMDPGPHPHRRAGWHLGRGADPVPRPPAVRHRDRRLGCPHGSPLDRPRGRDGGTCRHSGMAA